MMPLTAATRFQVLPKVGILVGGPIYTEPSNIRPGTMCVCCLFTQVLLALELTPPFCYPSCQRMPLLLLTAAVEVHPVDVMRLVAFERLYKNTSHTNLLIHVMRVLLISNYSGAGEQSHGLVDIYIYV